MSKNGLFYDSPSLWSREKVRIIILARTRTHFIYWTLHIYHIINYNQNVEKTGWLSVNNLPYLRNRKIFKSVSISNPAMVLISMDIFKSILMAGSSMPIGSLVPVGVGWTLGGCRLIGSLVPVGVGRTLGRCRNIYLNR